MALSISSKAIKSVRAVTLLAVAGLLAMPGLAKADETWTQTGSIGISGLTSFDISWVDFNGGLYLLADRSNKAIDLWPINRGPLFQFPGGFVGVAASGGNDFSGPNGVLSFINPHNGQFEMWAGDGPAVNAGCPAFLAGKCSAVKVITQFGSVSHTIPTGGAARADELCHDVNDRLILIANDAEADLSFGTPFISFISTDTYQIVGGMQIPTTTAGIEQCQWDPDTGLFFLNIPQVSGGDGQVFVITPPTGGNPPKLLGSYIIPQTDCANPQGMAQLVHGNNQMVLGCNALGPNGVRNSLIINKFNGMLIAIAWGLGGADQAWTNDTHYFITGSSCAAGSSACLTGGPQFGIVDHTPTLDQAIPLTPIAGVSSHSIAADCNVGGAEHSGQVFLPVAGGVAIFTNSALDTDGDAGTCPTVQ